MLGTIVNVSTIVTGTLLGSLIKKGLNPKIHSALFTSMGLAATGLGVYSIVQNMPNSKYPVLFIVSLAIGNLLGTALDLEERFHNVTNRFSKGNLAKGLSTAILLFCIGTLSILGPIQSAIYGDNSYLFTNATLDFVTSMVLSSTYGLGIGLSAIVLFLWQGSIYLFAEALSPFLTQELLTEISIVGGFLIASSGLGILEIRDCKTLNMLPSLLVPIVFFLLLSFHSTVFS